MPTVLAIVLSVVLHSQSFAQATRYQAAKQIATLEDARVHESSGLVASRRTPGVFWTHNDSGDGPFLFATDSKGRALARFEVTGAKNVDWEDIAAGPAIGDDAVLYIGDIGDNARKRTDTAIYRVYEPAVDITKVHQEGRTMIAERYPYQYPDGCHDAETLMVHPITGDVLIVTKDGSGSSGVYRFPMPLSRNQIVTLEKIATIQFSSTLTLPGRLAKYERLTRMATGGDIAPDASRLVVRTYTEAYEWTMLAGEPISTVFGRKPARYLLPLGQGESICYALDSRSLYLTAEGSPCPLWAMAPVKVSVPARK